MADEKKDTNNLEAIADETLKSEFQYFLRHIDALVPCLIELDLGKKTTREEALALRKILKSKYEYGARLPYSCPNENCEKPLMFTFANGASCYECHNIGTDLLYFPETKSAA